MKQDYPTTSGFTFRLQPFGLPTALFLLFFLLNFTLAFGQGVTISSNGDEGPVFTQQQTIPLSFEFDERINDFNLDDILVDNGTPSNFFVEWPDFQYTGISKRLKDFEIVINTNFFSGSTDFSPSSNAIIAIDIDAAGFIYALSLDEGVFKYDTNGNLTSNNPLISADKFTEPRDLALDASGNIFIANAGADQVLKFDNNGGNIEVLNSNTSLSSPTGLAISPDQKIYVADTDNNRVVIFNNGGGYAGQIDNGPGSGADQLLSPVRLAVDNSFNVYVTDAGNNRIQIYNAGGTHTGSIAGNSGKLNNPGSLVVDDYGFLYVADIAGVGLNTFLDFENISESEIIALALNLGGMRIQVFRTNDLNDGPKTINNAVNIPIDLAFKPCGYLAVNNSDATANNFPTIKFIFDLKTYEILPTAFTSDLQIEEECLAAEVSVNANVGKNADCTDTPVNGDAFTATWDETKPVRDVCNEADRTVPSGFIIPDYINNGEVSFNDNCGVENLTYNQTPEDGGTITQNTTVTIIATDEAGNVSEACTFELVVEEEEPDNAPQFTNCPQNIIEIVNDPGECGAVLDFETPEATDDKGNPTVTQISGPESGDFLSVEDGVVDLVFEANDGVNDPVTCTVQIRVVDDEKPVITCPDNITREIPAGENSIAINYALPEVSDNCSANLTPELIAGPESGSEFEEGTYTIEFQVIDDADNIDTCNFTITVTQADPEPIVTCPGNSIVDELELGDNCNYVLPEMGQYIQIENFESETFLVVGENLNGNILTVEVGVFEAENLIETCEFQFELIDKTPPIITCPDDITREIPVGENSIKIDYVLPEGSDNCSENLIPELIAGPESGSEFEEGTYTIEFQVTDDAGLIASCDFTITVTQADPAAPEIECVPYELILDENGQAILDPNSVYIGDRDDLQLSVSPKNFDCSNLGANTVTLTATDPITGLSSTCTSPVEIIDDIIPEANCVAPGREFQLQDGSVTISPSAIDLNSSDNCEITRTLSEDTFTTPGTKNITLYVEDEAGNTDECSTSIEILAEDDQSAQPSYECFEGDIPDLRLDENCEIEIPDYSYLVETENFTPRFEQTEERFGETLVVNLEVINTENNNLVGECTFSINIVDLIPPSISCPGDQIENFDPETGFEVPNYESWATFSDNCGEVIFRQEPEAGEIIYEDTTVQLFAEDANEQEASCSFELQLTEANVLNIFCQIDQNVSPDEDCSFTLLDYTDTAEVSLSGATVTQSPPQGTVINENTQIKLTASLDGETDDCFFMVNLVDSEDPVANCVSGYVVNLDANGNASIAPEVLDNNSTDNCGIVSMALSQTDFTRADIGEVPITLTVRDDAGNMDTCDTTVEVVDEASGVFECRENVVLNLNENGDASLSLQELYTGNASGITLDASRLNFNCSDLGSVQIQLDYSGAQSGSCMINVEVRDEVPPVINTDIVELNLDTEGFAYLEESDVLVRDNCSQELIYRFGKSVFSCEDVGSNSVNVEVEDANGNITEKNIEVRINGEACEIPDDIKFLFIYPNPNSGIFTIVTPEGLVIEQVRVFDTRGRYILEQDYNANTRFYRMTIQGVSASVYTLQIFTNEGVIVKRVIISP